MKEGDVVLTPLPQADGQVKNRPAIDSATTFVPQPRGKGLRRSRTLPNTDPEAQ